MAIQYMVKKKKKKKKLQRQVTLSISSGEDIDTESVDSKLIDSLKEYIGHIPEVDTTVFEVLEDCVIIQSNLTENCNENDDLEDILDPVADIEAVESPTTEQRKNLPDMAFAEVFKEGDRTRRILPHHVNSVKAADENNSVDIPRLRNALARFNQLKGVPRNVKESALKHIQAHARDLKMGTAKEVVYYDTLTLENNVFHSVPYSCCEEGNYSFQTPELVNVTISYTLTPEKEEETVKDSKTGLSESETVTNEADSVLEEVILLDSITLNEKEAAPNGKPFLAVLEGRGAVWGIINKNRRLYTKEGMEENVDRLKKQIERAFSNGKAELNHDIIPGEADHPGMFDGARLSATCTQLLDCTIEGNDVRVKFGLMDTTSGRDMLALKEYGIPLGVSTRSYGQQEIKTMDEDNEYYSLNKGFDGQEYAEIGKFKMEAFDLVVHPSAGAYIGEHERTLTDALVESYNRVTGENVQIKSDSSITNVINEVENCNTMDKETLKAALESVTAEDLQELVPNLCKEIEEKAAVAAVEGFKAVAEQEKAQATDTVLTELREAKAELTATKEIVNKLVSEKENADRKAALVSAIDEAVKGVSYGEACKSFLQEMLMDNPNAKAEDVPALVTKYKDNILPKFPPTESEVTEGVKKTGNGAGEFTLRYKDLGITKPIS